MPSRRRLAIARPTALAALLALSGACGGHASPDPTATAPAPLTAQSAVAPAPEPEAAPDPAPEPEGALAERGPPAAEPPGDDAPLRPLSDDERARFLAGDADVLQPTPIHYVKSNEVRHDVFFPYIRDLGGAYVGVGSDQNYTMIAAARSELVFLLDIDQRVVDLHRIYGILITASETPEALHARFDAGQADESARILEEALADAPEGERRRILKAYRTSRETVHLHLRHVIRRSRGGEATGWLSNPEMYAHIRALWSAGRVRPMAGDLTGSSSLQTVGKVSADLGIPVRVIYFSNAEEYFKYTPAFTANIKALGSDGRAMVLRTIYSKDWEHADQLWAYQVQPLSDFQARLDERKNRSRNPMLNYAEKDGTLLKQAGTGLSLLGLEPAPLAGG
ncbi:MAG: hypothetical protein H6711_11465 [Myxococcales bacterium]|nr:hypothetical protein [Myxococcales bacterium]